MTDEVMAISGSCIVVLLAHAMIQRDPVGLILYLVLPLPLNIVLFVKRFGDWVLKKEVYKMTPETKNLKHFCAKGTLCASFGNFTEAFVFEEQG